MKVLSRNYDRDDFLYKTSVEVSVDELTRVMRAIEWLVGIIEFKIHLTHQGQFIIWYDDTRPMKLGRKIAPKISGHQKELQKVLSHSP